MSELVDLVNADGEIQQFNVPIGVAETRYPDLHIQIAIAVVFNGHNILTHERARRESIPGRRDRPDQGKKDHVCGIVEAGEEPIDAAYRETREEVGLKIQKFEPVHAEVNSHRRYRHLFVGETDATDRHLVPNPREVAWAAFFTPEKLAAMKANGQWEFVSDFFPNLELASQARRTVRH